MGDVQYARRTLGAIISPKSGESSPRSKASSSLFGQRLLISTVMTGELQAEHDDGHETAGGSSDLVAEMMDCCVYIR